MIYTTLNIKLSVLGMIGNAASIRKVSRSQVIVLLLQRAMRDNERLFDSYKRVKYQKGDDNDPWHKFHIKFNRYQYDFCLDQRRFYKMSVSFILAFAVENYLDEILNQKAGAKNTKIIDNSEFRDYFLVNETVHGVICWRTYWGIPKNWRRILKL